MKRLVRLTLFKNRCASHGACAAASRVFGEMRDHVPVIPDNVTALLDSDRDEVIDAVLSCPTAAIEVQYEDGTVITADDYEAEGGLRRWIAY